MNPFDNPKFKNAILDLAKVYGPYEFWLQNLNPVCNPNAIWRALLLIGCISDIRFITPVRQLLTSPISRVRAWSCFALSQMMDRESGLKISQLSKDHSYRVRYHAKMALEKLGLVYPVSQNPYLPHHMRHKLKLIISDDSVNIQKQLTDRFNNNGYEVLSSSESIDTIELAKKSHPDFIITDNQKYNDNLSGLDMTWDITREPRLDESTIVMLTADHLEAIFTWNGGDFFFNKNPLHLNTLDFILEDCALSKPIIFNPEVVNKEVHLINKKPMLKEKEPQISIFIEDCIRQLTSPKILYSYNEIKSLSQDLTKIRGLFACYSRVIPANIIIPQEFRFSDSVLLYIGICPAFKNDRTLPDRWKEIFEGDADAAIIRLTLGCLLSKMLNIKLTWQKGKWTFLEGEKVLSKWIAENISIIWYKNSKPWEIKKQIIQEICPALNDLNNPKNPNQKFLRKLRKECKK